MTPTMSKMLNMLKMRPRSVADLKICLWDEFSGDSTVRNHICQLRKYGYDVRCRRGIYTLLTLERIR